MNGTEDLVAYPLTMLPGPGTLALGGNQSDELVGKTARFGSPDLAGALISRTTLELTEETVTLGSPYSISLMGHFKVYAYR